MTATIHDRLIGRRRARHMRSYVPIGRKHPLILSMSDEDVMKKWPGLASYEWSRGFVGEWRIADGRLYLLRVYGVFNYDGTEPIHATWVTQEITVPVGPVVHNSQWHGIVRAGSVHYFVERGMVTAARFERFIKPESMLAYEAERRASSARREEWERREAQARARRERLLNRFPWLRRWIGRDDAESGLPRVW